MGDVQQKIREEAKNLLVAGKVDCIIGFKKGTLPLRASPAFVYSEDDAEELIWNSFCENNLATYLTKVGDRKVGIVAKGCDTRSIVALITEKQIKREQVVIIGMPCQRMVDRRKVEKQVGGEILRAEEKEEEVLVEGDGFEESLKKESYLYPSCETCRFRNPVISDILIGERVKEEPLADEYVEVAEYEGKSVNERWEYFSEQISRCIRCYACRQACPMCYCEECFVDSSYPKWIDKGLDSSDVAIWNIIRAYHQAGRCVDCGACERACPMGINLRLLNKKVNREVKDYFSFEAGLDTEIPPPLATFDVKDRQDFIHSGE